MTRKQLACALAVAAGGISATASQALADGPVATAADPYFFDYASGQTFRNNAGDTVDVLYGLSLQAKSNSQVVGGTIGGSAFSGIAIAHTYSKVDDAGTYDISGTTAGAVPTPFAGTLAVRVDRGASSYQLVLVGDLGGVPVHEATKPRRLPI
jgi:hypothetical protein